MKKTGIFATEKEFEQISKSVNRGWQAGETMIVFSVAEGINKDLKTRDAKELCHAIALSHGLPEITGFYGIDLNKEFLTM